MKAEGGAIWKQEGGQWEGKECPEKEVEPQCDQST